MYVGQALYENDDDDSVYMRHRVNTLHVHIVTAQFSPARLKIYI